jgi:archaellum component FlaC
VSCLRTPPVHDKTCTDIRWEVNKLKSPFRGFDLDDLFAKIRSSAERVRVCAEDIMDNIHVETNEISKNIHSITQQTEGGVGELREKIEEILRQQKTLQASLEAVSSKNSLLSFLTEYLSK